MITLASDPLLYLGNVPITNTLVDTLVVDLSIIGLATYVHKKTSLVPNFFQSILELAVEGLYGLTQSTAGKHTQKIFPYVMSFFIFILLSNLSGLMPILTSIGFYHGKEFTPFIRSAATDLNTTVALALVSLSATHIMSIKTLGLRSYISRFISLKPLALYTGILELISEITKIISFSFRLFGNIFVGEVILASISSVFAFLLPVPVMFYELFVGIIQALIFALLTMAFMSIYTTAHNPTEEH